MSKLRLSELVIGIVVALSALTSAAELRFSRHYDDKMVLQREKPVLIRGFASNGVEVAVTFSGQTKKAIADGNGEWAVTLDPMPANGEGAELVAQSGEMKVSLGDVVVGDVFLFARQTTIDVSLGRDQAGKDAAVDLPSVRVMMIKTVPAVDPRPDLAEQAVSGWTPLDKKTALQMNAAAFYLARGVATHTDVPVGIIDLNLGLHFPIAWLSKDALLQTTEVFGNEATQVNSVMDMMAAAKAKFEDDEERKKQDATRGYPATHPREDPRYPAAGYNAVLHPMRGLVLKGLILQLGNNYPYILYQGLVRNGTNTNRAHLGQAYKDSYDIRKWCIYLDPITVPRIPRVWRKTFGDDALPIGWIAPTGSDLVTTGRQNYEMRELLRRVTLKERGVDLILPGTEHVPFSAQPADEALLGARCLNWLTSAVYRIEGSVPTGPVFDRMTVDYSTAQIFFKPGTARGLNAKPRALDFFEVAGVDLKYAPAKARIDGETIRLSSDEVTRIAHVRYNWTEKPNQGLTSANGLPVIPFNTDGHEYPKTIDTVGEETLPKEMSTPITEWKSQDAVIVNGQLDKSVDAGKFMGPTGLRVSAFGPNRYVNSVYAGSPADGKILAGDYLYAVNGQLFRDNIEKQIAEAITHAETEEGKGIISFDLMRDGTKMTVQLQLEVLGTYSVTSPYDCPKTDRIVANAEAFLARYGGAVPGHPTFMNPDAMFLLAAGSPEYQGLVRRHVYNRIAQWDATKAIDPLGKESQGGPWVLSADALLMAEYYLATGDEGVLPYLKFCCDGLTAVQIRSLEEQGPWPEVQPGQTGGWRHNFYGGAKYGTMPAIQVPAALGYHLAQEAGVRYDPRGYDRAVKWFLHNGAEVGNVGYGYHAEPVTSGNNIDPDALAAGMLNPGNGGVAGAAVLFDLRGNGPVARTCSFIATYSYNNTAYAHGGHFWVNFYNPLGAKIHSKESFQFFMKQNRWYQELHRMYDYSRQQDRGFGAGQFLAYVAPRERLRILGAHESVFAINPPAALQGALEAYQRRDYEACEKSVTSLIAAGDLAGLDLKKAEQLRDAVVLIQKSIAHDLAKVKGLIAENMPYEASLDLAQLKAVLPEANPELAAIAKALSDPALKDAMAQGKKRHDAYIQSLALRVPAVKDEDGGVEWKSLVSREDLKQKSEDTNATMWRMKILEALSQAPEGWTENDFDDSSWQETRLPISWHTNHTALFRAPFEITDTRSVKALRLRQWAFRQEDMQVFINGALVAKITPSGSGGQEITVPLNAHALSLLKTGRNTLSATYKNTWRWGRYTANQETPTRNSVYNGGVHLILEMIEEKR